MPKKRIGMNKIREIIRLRIECGLSERQVSSAINVSRPVVSNYVKAFECTGLTYDQIKEISDSNLSELLTGKKKLSKKAEELFKRFPAYAKELKKKGVTLQLLWEEYIEENPDGLKSTQFNHYFRQWCDDEEISMHIEHIAGDKMYIDYTGHKLKIIDRGTGEEIPVEVYVAILPASQFTYVEASKSQKQEEFVRSTERAIRYFGGVPAALCPDNLKSAVIKADIYEPEINNMFSDFADHYRTVVVPARARKPKDKAHVENAVKICYRRIFAPLRNKVFYSLEELNEAIKYRLEIHNNKKLSKMEVSRRELFNEIEKDVLRSLPIEQYPIKHYQDAKVGINYHVLLKEDKHYYSVPFIYRKKQVKIVYDERNISIYHDNLRIVQHKRNLLAHKYTTKKDHMPINHRYKDDWNPERLKFWADSIGRQTLFSITHILESKVYPEQAYKSCLGILGQAKKYGNDILESACRNANNAEQIRYKFICEQTKIIKQQIEDGVNEDQPSFLPETHENIRGREFYR